MLENYDFSKGVKNPYAARLKKQAEETSIPYQKLVSFYLADCAKKGKHLEWT